MRNYKEMTVEELRQETRGRGMTLQYKGKKFTKPELIKRLEENDSEILESPEVEFVGENSDPEPKKEVCVESKVNRGAKEKMPHMPYAETLEEIERRYLYRREQHIYDTKLVPGSIVYFIHYITTKKGKYLKKLRTARVKEVNREKEIVYAETIFGTNFKLRFDELLYIRQFDERGMVPSDLHNFLRKQRTIKGREGIYEKFRQGIN